MYLFSLVILLDYSNNDDGDAIACESSRISFYPFVNKNAFCLTFLKQKLKNATNYKIIDEKFCRLLKNSYFCNRKNKISIKFNNLTKERIMANQVKKTNESEVWFVVFGVGDGRSDHYGWMAFWKDECSKMEARKAGDRAANRKGEANYNYYFFKKTTYVTDSISAFKKKCEKVGLRPSESCLSEYGY